MIQISGSYVEQRKIFLEPVAIANFDQQSTSITFNLLDNPETGDYILCDILTVEVADTGSTVQLRYNVSWMGDNNIPMHGYFSDGLLPGEAGDGIGLTAISQGTTLAQASAAFPHAQLDATWIETPPTVLHAVKGTPIVVSVTLQNSTTLRFSYHATLWRLQ